MIESSIWEEYLGRFLEILFAPGATRSLTDAKLSLATACAGRPICSFEQLDLHPLTPGQVLKRARPSIDRNPAIFRYADQDALVSGAHMKPPEAVAQVADGSARL